MFRQTKIHSAEPLRNKCRVFEFEVAKKTQITRYSSAQGIKAGCRTVYFVINKLTNSVWNN